MIPLGSLRCISRSRHSGGSCSSRRRCLGPPQPGTKPSQGSLPSLGRAASQHRPETMRGCSGKDGGKPAGQAGGLVLATSVAAQLHASSGCHVASRRHAGKGVSRGFLGAFLVSQRGSTINAEPVPGRCWTGLLEMSVPEPGPRSPRSVLLLRPPPARPSCLLRGDVVGVCLSFLLLPCIPSALFPSCP